MDNAVRLAQYQEKFLNLQKVLADQENRLHKLQASAFQLANYFFVFQGVVLSAISNNSALLCSDAWFIFVLSILAAIINLFALFSIGMKYVRSMNLNDSTWSECNQLLADIRSIENAPDQAERSAAVDDSPASFPMVKRYLVFALCSCVFLGFTAVTLAGPWVVICKQDKNRRPHDQDNDCIKLCKAAGA